MDVSTGAFYDAFWSTRAPETTCLGAHEAERLRRIDAALVRQGGGAARGILDIGCGTGWLTRHLSRFGRAVGVDFSATAIELAKAGTADGRAAFHVRNVLDEPLADLGRFDTVVAAEVIEHVVDKPAFIEICREALVPGGLLIVTTPNAGVWHRYWASSVIDAARWRQPVEEWVTRNEMAALLKAGFELVDATSYVLDFDNTGIYRFINSYKVGRVLDRLSFKRWVTRALENQWLGLYGCYVARKK